MKVYLEKPTTWLESERDGDRNRLMYTNLCEALSSLPLSLTEIPISFGHDFDERIPPTDGFYLSYHSIGNSPYVWRAKETPLPFYYSIDRLGHSGWSELSEKSIYAKAHLSKINQVDDKAAQEFTQGIYQWLISKNLSKYKQPDTNQELPSDFVFYPMQTQTDPVRVHDRLNTIKLLFKAATYAKKQKKHLVIKRHPYCKDIRMTIAIKYLLLSNKYITLSNISVTKLIDKCVSVLTGNSGVGLEALFYGKTVYSFSYSEYDCAVEKVTAYSDIKNAFSGEKKNNLNAKKFLYYYFNELCFDARDVSSIKKRLSSIICISQERAWFSCD